MEENNKCDLHQVNGSTAQPIRNISLVKKILCFDNKRLIIIENKIKYEIKSQNEIE